MDVKDDAVADIALHSLAHDARWHEVELIHALLGTLAHNQRVAGIVTALEAYDALRVVGQPVNDLALAFVTPLGANHHDILSHIPVSLASLIKPC